MVQKLLPCLKSRKAEKNGNSTLSCIEQISAVFELPS